jgi:hypothetical protein
MWVQTHQTVSDRPGVVPLATPLRQAPAAGSVGSVGSGTAADARARAGESTAAPQQQPGRLSSAPGSEGTFFLADEPPAAAARDSFASIIDDPFFLRFETPVLSAPSTAPATTSAGHRHDERQPWIPPRKESLSDTNPTPWVGSLSPISQ